MFRIKTAFGQKVKRISPFFTRYSKSAIIILLPKEKEGKECSKNFGKTFRPVITE